jgi:hypothetical protein
MLGPNGTSLVKARLQDRRRVRESLVSRWGGEERADRREGFAGDEVLRRNVSVTFVVSVRDRADSNRVLMCAYKKMCT